MARENIRLSEGNFTSDGTYFYCMLDSTQALQQKVDDGTVAFTYPLDTAIPGGSGSELHWDGVYFWTMESSGSGLIIRKWAIEAFICQQKALFNFPNGVTHTYSSSAFALEHYRLTVGNNDNGSGGYTTGFTDILISDTSMLDPGDVLTFVRTGTSAAQRYNTTFVEEAVVQSVLSPTMVRLTTSMTGNPHGDGKGFRGPAVDIDSLGGSHPPTPDQVFVTKYIWIANNNTPGAPGTPALYKIRASNGSNVSQFSGVEYSSIGGMAFYTKYDQGVGLDNAGATKYNTAIVNDPLHGGRQTYLLLGKSSTMLFFNVSTFALDRTLIMNNIKVDTINTWPVFNLLVGGIEPNIVVYRLQQGTTYKNSSLNLVDESWGSQFNYEKQLLRRVVSSIAVSAEPSIVPADGNATAAITATLRDQYNDLIPSGKTVNWSDDSGGSGGGTGQGLFNAQSVTDSFGVAKNTYKAGTTEKDVKITAAVTNGLID